MGASPLIVQAETLRQFAGALLQAMGTPPDVAAEVAAHLVGANMSGADAHGVARLPDYAAESARGVLLPGARPRLERTTAVTALFDAGRGFGQYAAAAALRWCLERVPEVGIAAAAVRSADDVGRLAEYAERAAEGGMLAVVTAGAAGPDAGETMLYGGRQRFFGANPWAFAVPGRARSLTFDGSTSTVAASEVLLARAKGEQLPPDCLYDRFGRPSTDPDDLAAGGGLVPLGGAVAGHKGFGLAFASALLAGLAGDGRDGGGVGGVFIEVIDPAAFGEPDAYRERVDRVLAAAKSVRPVAGRSEVLLPGEAEARSRAERERAGIRLPDATWTDLRSVADWLKVPLPQTPGR